MLNRYSIYRLVIMLLLPAMVLFAGCEKHETDDTQKTDAENIPQANLSSSIDNETAKGIPVVLPQRNPLEFKSLVPYQREPQEITVVSHLTETRPQIDGLADDSIWDEIEPIETLDHSSQRPIIIKSCHNQQKIFFLITFPDIDKNDTHKSWVWNDTEQIYVEGPDREDTLVLKWKTSGGNMSFNRELVEPHTADIWFWKACRTNQSGYFDDKSHIVSESNIDNSLEIESEKYDKLFLVRKADDGKAAYTQEIFFTNLGPALHKFYPVQPKGSRADIIGKGIWAEGKWTIECERELNTGQRDDVEFMPGQDYEFGISLYEMACTGVEPKWHIPLYRTGNVFDKLILTLEQE